MKKYIIMFLFLINMSGCAWLGGSAAGFQAQCDKLVGLSSSELVAKIGAPSHIKEDKINNMALYHYFHFYWTYCNTNFIIKNGKVVSYAFEGGDCLDFEDKQAVHPILKEVASPKYYTPDNRAPKQQNYNSQDDLFR